MTLGFDAALPVRFREVPIPSLKNGAQIGSGIIDWWPTAEIPTRRVCLTRDGTFGAYWQTKKGTLHTAELLKACDDDPEMQAAVFMAASAWDKQNPLPEAWRGRIYRLLYNVLVAIAYDHGGPFKSHGLSAWHHAMRDALPVNMIGETFAESIILNDHTAFAHIAALEMALSTSLWTLVVVSNDEPGLRSI